MYRLHYAPDNASLIIRLVLEEMRQPYTAVLVDRRVSAQNSAAYRQLNPRGLIPVLETPHGPVFETAAILLWLADTHASMAPDQDHPARAGFLSWLFAVSNGLHADLRQLFYPAQYAASDDQVHRALCIDRIRTHLDRLEDLAGGQHIWFNAPDPSVLDYYVTTICRWMALYPKGGTDWFDPGKWPHLQAMAMLLETREAVGRSSTAEGLGPTPFSAPHYASPPEGSAT